MRIIAQVVLTFLLISSLISCVTRRQYDLMVEHRDRLLQDSVRAEELEGEKQKLFLANQKLEAMYNKATDDLEHVQATNKSLINSYRDIKQDLNNEVDKKREYLSASSYEKIQLEEKISERDVQLDSKVREMEYLQSSLYNANDRMRGIQNEYSEYEDNLTAKDARISELERMLALQESRMREFREQVISALSGFSADELSVHERNGKLYVSLSTDLLFKLGSKKIDWKGKRALQQLAQVLNRNRDIQINVEGHTDPQGGPALNWDLSVHRATAVVKVLTNYGVDPKSIIASGKAYYDPVAENTSDSGRAKNRRTEIILSPNLDQLYQILGQ